MNQLRSFLKPLLLFCVIVVLSLSLTLLDYSWEGWRPAPCMPDHCFCERPRNGVIRQPSNAWSNHAFVLVGLLIIAIARDDLSQTSQLGISNPMKSEPIYPTIYGIVTMLLGIGSMLFHISLTFVGVTIDVISMYLLASFMLLYNLFRTTQISNKAFVAYYLLMNVIFGYIAINLLSLRSYVFGVLLLAVLVTEVLIHGKLQPKMKVPFLYIALISSAVAFTIWILDNTKVVCSPDSWLQGHAIWHLLTAASVGFVYLYYRSESR